MSCPDGHRQPELNQQEVIHKEKLPERRGIEVAEAGNILAVHEHQCKRCGYDKAELIEIMPSYSDEDNMFRMKCGRCGLVEQLEGKVK